MIYPKAQQQLSPLTLQIHQLLDKITPSQYPLHHLQVPVCPQEVFKSAIVSISAPQLFPQGQGAAHYLRHRQALRQ